MEREKLGTRMGQGVCEKGWKDWISESRGVMLQTSEVEQINSTK